MKTYSFRVNHMALLTEMRVASVTGTGALTVHYLVLLDYLAAITINSFALSTSRRIRRSVATQTGRN